MLGAWTALPPWDAESQKQVRDALLILASSLPDTARMFGSREKVDPVRHLIGTASAWGGNPETEALYLNVTPSKNDGTTIYMLNVPADVPVSGFWSISRYGADGYYHANELNAYTLNNMTAKKEPDGSTKVQFGGCSKGIENCLRSRAAGTTWCGSTGPERACWTVHGNSRTPYR